MCDGYEPSDVYEPFPLNESVDVDRDGSFDDYDYDADCGQYDDGHYDDDPSPYDGNYPEDTEYDE